MLVKNTQNDLYCEMNDFYRIAKRIAQKKNSDEINYSRR